MGQAKAGKPLETVSRTVIVEEMNRLLGFALVAGFLVSSAAASGAVAGAYDRSASLAAPVVQEPIASSVGPLPAAMAKATPAITQRIIHASQGAAGISLAPAAAEAAPASQASPNSCAPSHSDMACRRP